jgi:hypothetical protein
LKSGSFGFFGSSPDEKNGAAAIFDEAVVEAVLFDPKDPSDPRNPAFKNRFHSAD